MTQILEVATQTLEVATQILEATTQTLEVTIALEIPHSELSGVTYSGYRLKTHQN